MYFNYLLNKEISNIQRKIQQTSNFSFKRLFIVIIFGRIFLNHKPKTAIITGYKRTGKSIICNQLAKDNRLLVLETDLLRNIYSNISDKSLRYSITKAFYSRLIKRFPQGIILEGDELIFMSPPYDAKNRKPSLKDIALISNDLNAKTFVIGNASANINTKTKGLEQYRKSGKCWTSSMEKYQKENKLQEVAQKSIEISQLIQKESFAYSLVYFDLRPDFFCEDISTICNKINEIINVVDKKT